MRTSPAESWERLTTANDDIDAQLLVGVLEDASIETKVVKDRSGYGDYLYGGSNPWAPVAVHVHPSRLEDARRVLAAFGDERPDGAGPPPVPASHLHWPTVVAVAIVGLIVLAFLLEQRNLFL
jgi:putative signal transducing protein